MGPSESGEKVNVKQKSGGGGSVKGHKGKPDRPLQSAREKKAGNEKIGSRVPRNIPTRIARGEEALKNSQENQGWRKG